MKYRNSYKGKWFILGDEEDDWFGADGTIEDGEITDEFLLEHVSACMYYGIPPYIGGDAELHERIEQIYKKVKVDQERDG